MKRVEYRVHFGDWESTDSHDFDIVHHSQWHKWIDYEDQKRRVVWIERFEEHYTSFGEPHIFYDDILWEVEE